MRGFGTAHEYESVQCIQYIERSLSLCDIHGTTGAKHKHKEIFCDCGKCFRVSALIAVPNNNAIIVFCCRQRKYHEIIKTLH